MISNKDVVYDELTTFWKKPRYPRFIPPIQPSIFNYLFVAFKTFSGQNYYFKMGQLRKPFTSKWGKHFFKVG